jgi:hypothetical protein
VCRGGIFVAPRVPPAETPHQSPQLPLWTWGEDDWLPVLRLPAYARRQPQATSAVQRPLFAPEAVGM